MCKDATSSGTLSAPHNADLKTGIEMCQKSGTFVNGTTETAYIFANGVQYTIPAGKAATVPVDNYIRAKLGGRGQLAWAVTGAVLAAEMVDAPATEERPTDTLLTFNISQPELFYRKATEITLSSGNYNKLLFILGKPEEVIITI